MKNRIEALKLKRDEALLETANLSQYFRASISLIIAALVGTTAIVLTRSISQNFNYRLLMLQLFGVFLILIFVTFFFFHVLLKKPRLSHQRATKKLKEVYKKLEGLYLSLQR